MTLTRVMTGIRLPRWAVLLIGVVGVVVGATLITRPFQSLSVLIILVAIGMVVSGLGDLSDRPEGGSGIATTTGYAWILGGLAVLLWPGMSLRLLTIIVGIALIVGGLGRLVPAIRGTADQRAAGILLGAASVILGLLALLWPDITVLVVAIVFGVRVLFFGLAQIIRAIRWPDPAAPEDESRPPGTLRRWANVLGAGAALIVALGLVVVSSRLHEGEPTVDAFYDAPDEVPAEPGQLLRSEAFDRGIPDGAQAWRILYTTTRGGDEPALGSALVVVDTDASPDPHPVIAWTHGTTGVESSCAPTLLPDPLAAGVMPAIDQVMANGWAVVATDYIGLGTEGPHGYLVGEEAGRGALDAVRAAHQLDDVELSDQTVVWGHSQGGGAALWTGVLAPSYAPDANVIAVAALAPASDLPGLVSNLDVVPGGALFASFVIQGFSDTYDDVSFDEYIKPQARIQVREMAARCLAEPQTLLSAVESLLFDQSIWATDPTSGAFGQRLEENIPVGPIDVPLLVGQGLGDELVLPTAQDAYVAARCDAGGAVDYRTYQGFDHVSVVTDPSSPLVPELLAWTTDRLDGVAAESTCP